MTFGVGNDTPLAFAMHQNIAILILILLSLVSANAPFATERPLLLLPWVQPNAHSHAAWQRWLLSSLWIMALVGVAWLAQWWIGQAVVAGGVFLLRIVAVIAMAIGLLTLPGRYLGTPQVHKPVAQRCLELCVLYACVGILGFAFEAYLGSVFPQRWEFYVVTFSLFLVMGYPGFVLRYLLKPRKRPPRRQPS